MNVTHADILHFWFHELGEDKWFFAGDDVDALMRQRFAPAVTAALENRYDTWAASAEGRLALILLLDQFTRNIFRNQPFGYAGDSKAQRLTVDGIEKQMDLQLSPQERHFFYMPLMHAEDKKLQALSVQKFTALRDDGPDVTAFARGHHDIVEKFGRFPHRNKILGRTSTDAEIAFLASKDNPFHAHF